MERIALLPFSLFSLFTEAVILWQYTSSLFIPSYSGKIRLAFIRNCREIICIFLESMLIYVMNEFSDSGGHFHDT